MCGNVLCKDLVYPFLFFVFETGKRRNLQGNNSITAVLEEVEESTRAMIEMEGKRLKVEAEIEEKRMKHEMDLKERRREHKERMEERRRAEELRFEDRMHRMMSCFLQQTMGFSSLSPPPAGTAFSHQPIPHQPIPHESSPNHVYHNSNNYGQQVQL